jgi:lipopolysaccharide/colanic/teichoic acid biosynthesis glycosyltransferase
MKRAFDILVSTIGLIIAFIPMLIIALAIKLEDGGPVFYKQERMKRNNKIFKVLKFRSMKVHNEDENEKIASVNDNRITKVGKVIRMLRVDELPQLLNIFKGEMSLVGPRPLMLSVIEQTLKDHPEFRYRSNVKPGLTGLAQISSRYDTKDNEKLRYDLYYIRNYSFWYDLKILLLTVKTVLTKEQSVGREFNETFEDKVSNGSIVTEAIPSGYKIISK